MNRLVLCGLCAAVFFVISPVVPATAASGRDKAEKCNEVADKRNLEGDDRRDFMQECLGRASDSQDNKRDACNEMADKRNLQGSDRRSFLKDCMKR